MATKTYKVVNGRNEIEYIQADRAELTSNNNRLMFFLDEDVVGSYVGFASFNVVAPVPPVEDPAV